MFTSGDGSPTPARAYKICNNVTGWTEKANYSECLNLIVNLPQPRVNSVFRNV